jgi:P-type Ca2+ transporter type 2C
MWHPQNVPPMNAPRTCWHQMNKAEALEQLQSSTQGLTTDAAKLRTEQFGLNELKEVKKTSPWLLFLNQFKGFMIYVLMIAAIISGIVGDISDAVIIIIIVLLNVLLGFVQEYRTERAMDALSFVQLGHVFAIRSNREFIFSIGFFSNVPLLFAVLFTTFTAVEL